MVPDRSGKISLIPSRKYFNPPQNPVDFSKPKGALGISGHSNHCNGIMGILFEDCVGMFGEILLWFGCSGALYNERCRACVTFCCKGWKLEILGSGSTTSIFFTIS